TVRASGKTACWQIELNSLTQQEHERVDTYATKFKRLLNHVNSNNCLPDAYIVRMFLGGLKDMNAALVAIVAPKSLSETVAAARRVEAGNYYGQHNAKVAKQVRVGSELSDLKKRIDEMALNYAALTSKIKDAPAIPKNKA
ncbi:11784_t:CDS:1, partial [Gigaspora margarita]